MDNPPPDKIGFKNIQVFDDNIGIGAYGSVHKAMCDDLLCAAKKIHGILVETVGASPNAGGHRIPIRRFKSEFQLLQELRHPNIIQYLGIYDDPTTQLPVLLMDLMDESLTHYLENSDQPIPYHTQVNICLDITRALSHLHINGIVHRDLSSNNILLCGKPCKAKLSDFGMAKFLNTKATRSRISDTSVPGAHCYMPPEAFDDNGNYFKEKGDVFSFGVVIVQILTKKFPSPSARFRDVVIANDSRRLKECLSELERRENHLQLIQQDHSLLPIALKCLSDNESDRPDASDLCNRLATLTNSAPYLDSKSTEEKPPKSMEDKSVATECSLQDKSCATEYDPQCEYIFLAPDSASVERIQHLEQALSEEKDVVFSKNAELKAVADQLETKQAVADKLIDSNDRLLSRQKQLEKQLQEKENTLENVSQEKNSLLHTHREMKADLEKQIKESRDFTSKQQQQLIEKEQELNDQRTKIGEQSRAIKEHLELQNQQKKQLDEQTNHIAQQQEQINDLEAEVATNSKKKKKHQKQSKEQKKPTPSAESSANGTQVNQAQRGSGFRLSIFKSRQPKSDAQSKQEGKFQSDSGANHRDKVISSDVFTSSPASTVEVDINPIDNPLPGPTSSAETTQSTSMSLSRREAAARERIETSTKNSIALLKDIQQSSNATVTTEVLQHWDNNIPPQNDAVSDKLSSVVTGEQLDTKPDTPLSQASPEPGSVSEAPLKPRVQVESKQATPLSGLFSRFFSKKETKPSSEQVSPPSSTEKPSSKQNSSKKASKDKVTPVRATSYHKSSGSQNNPFDDNDNSGFSLTSKRLTQQQSQELKQREQRALREMEASSARSLRTATDAHRIGVDTMIELKRQSEGLDRTEARLDETHAAASKMKPGDSKPSVAQSKKREVTKHSLSVTGPNPAGAANEIHSASALSQLPSTGSDVVDKNLEELGAVLHNMKSMGLAMGDALDQQNGQVGRIQEKIKRNDITFAAANRDIKRQL